MIKNLLVFTFMISFNSFAENSRSPAVLDGSCNLDIATTFKMMENGKEVIKEKTIEEVQKEQCKEVKKCMFSAMEEEMEELKSLEAVACSNTLTAITTKTPGAIVDKNFDGTRKAKPNPLTDTVPPMAADKPAATMTR